MLVKILVRIAIMGIALLPSAAYCDLSTFSDGLSLATAVHNRPTGESVYARARMTLKNTRGPDRIREFHSFKQDFADGETRYLIRFTKPANVDGVGLLMHNSDDAEDQWLYLPALDRVRRISNKNRGGRFVQSGVYYEDLRDRSPSKDRHRIIGEGDYDGTPTTMLESTPHDPSTSTYSKQVSWIHIPTLVPLRIDYYKQEGRLTKQLEVQRIDNIEGIWTVIDSSITHPKTGEVTILNNLETRYGALLPKRLFTTAGLQDTDFDYSTIQ